MSKKAEYYDEAERMYVTQQMTFNEISSRLKIAEKTVRNWAEEGGWQAKRSELMKKRKSLHEMLYDAAQLIMQSIVKDLEDGQPVDAGRLYSVRGMIATLEKSRTYEVQTGNADEQVTKKEVGLTAEKLAEIKDLLRL